MGDTKKRKARGGEPPKKRPKGKTGSSARQKSPLEAFFSNPVLTDELALAHNFDALSDSQKEQLQTLRPTVYAAAIAAFKKKTILEKSKQGNSSGARASTSSTTKKIPENLYSKALQTLVFYGDSLDKNALVKNFNKLNPKQQEFLIKNYLELHNRIMPAVVQQIEKNSKCVKSRSV